MKTGKFVNPQKQHHTPVVTVLILAVIVVLAIAAFFISQALKKISLIDPFDYIDIRFSGYEGNGTAKLEYRKGALIKSILLEDDELGDSWLLEYDVYDQGIQVECTPDQGFSNGDTVTVTVSVSKEAGKKVKFGVQTVTVEGLPDVETVDIFADVDLVYEGIGDITQAKLQMNSDSELLHRCSFRVEPEFGIRNGDMVTVTLQNPDTITEQFLCIPKETFKTFVVSGLEEYLTDPDLLPENAIRDIITRFLSDSTKQNDSWFSYTQPQYYKTYFFTPQEGSFFTEENILEIYVCYDEFLNGEYRQTIFAPIKFYNLVLRADGTVDLDYENGSSATFYTDPDTIPEQDGYDVEEVYIEYETQ